MMTEFKGFFSRYRLILLLIISAVARLVIGSLVELGNDEVYYINYALYPDLSHFDHPPMVGWFIQFFTLNLTFQAEGWIRLAAVFSGTLSTWLIYLIGRQIGDRLTGWYAALLYTSSFYGFVITGLFMMPDGPQMVFWLAALLFLLKSIEKEETKSTLSTSEKATAVWFLLAGLCTGLALLSKYTSAFILFGTFLYFLRNRQWFKKWYVYLGVVVAFICFIPVIIWNYQHDFISFTFHSDRIEVTNKLFRLDTFAKEVAGQILYNNPVVFFLTLIALISFYKHKLCPGNKSIRLLVNIALPLILIFLVISLFRSTLPHWSGPAYVTLIPLTAAWIRQNTTCGRKGLAIPRSIAAALLVLVLVITLALLQLFEGVIFNKGIDPATGKRLGWKDITLDMYGWKQLNAGFTKLYHSDLQTGKMDSTAVIISHRWFPAANIDYYVARPNGITLLTLAPLERTHKYAWITEYRGGIKPHMNAYFISSSYDFEDPRWNYEKDFSIQPPDTIPVYRKQLLVKYYYVWKMKVK
ncbi:MAG TPA: glycosyltransferase family 39 protein [Lentimicrobium sp.]|nr:glycosyltransferase family 39 protein [Lentimicrobium sp.]